MFITRICFLLVCIIAHHILNGQDFQIPIGRFETNTAMACNNPHFIKPVVFTKQGMQNFITYVYNTPEYGTDFLPNNLYHLVQFLHNNTTQPRNYAQSVLRMFGNKLKQSLYINPYAFSELLEEITPLLKKLTTSTSSNLALQCDIAATMETHMLHNFDHLKADPAAYFKELAHNITQLIQQHNHCADITIDALRKSIVIFLEITINKLIWAPDEPKRAWNSVKLISDQLHTLLQENILIDKGDLNALYTTLFERLCLYLDLAFSNLPITFYDTLRQEIAHKNAAFFHLEDNQLFETKAQRLERILTLTEAKTRAYHAGIIVS